MRTLLGLIVCGGLAIAVCGCGAPEAEFSWSEETQDLMPGAENAVVEYTTQRFGTPANMVGWQRLPVAFGGIPGRVLEQIKDEATGLVTALKIDFLAQAMIARYDRNLDGRLALAEFPAALQQEITPEKFQQADADEDGFLSGPEINRLRVRSELLIKDTVSRIDEDLAEDLVGKDLLFVNGTFAYREGQTEPYKVEVTGIDAETGVVEIWPPLSDTPRGEKKPVELVIRDVVIDFGRTMRSGRHLYMRHCVHCHGVTGDGNGPTAQYLNPRPRDYRDGVFKFVSTRRDIVAGRPNRDDLDRILRHGIPGTYMPSFAMLKDEEVAEIIEYIRWLAMRGQFENSMNVVLLDFANETLAEEIERKVSSYEAALERFEEQLAAGETTEANRPKPVSAGSIRREKQTELEEFLQEDLREDVDVEVDIMVESWREAEVARTVVYPSVPKPPSTQESIARGRQLYLGKCAVCHGRMAEGNGENTRGYQKDPEGNEYPEPGFFDIWGMPIQPRNLTLGVYRGGRRPLDIYRRIHQGIPGTPMQAFNATFTDEQIWDLVDYVMSIPIEGPIPQSENENIPALQSASQPAGTKAAEKKPAPPENGEEPKEQKPAVAESPANSQPNEENDE